MFDPWLNYCAVVEQYKDNAHVPQIHKLTMNSDYYVAVVEKLTHWSYQSQKDLIDLCNSFCNNEITSKQLEIELEEYAEAVPNPGKLIEILKSIKRFADNNDDVVIDLHSHNIMFRDEIIVITDPIAEKDVSADEGVIDWLECAGLF